jgi:hypothetical protein
MRWAFALAIALAACGGKSQRPRSAVVPVPTVAVGDCGTPGTDGVMGERPEVVHADRDLDGDGVPEVVVADRTMCTPEGNCYWNVFVPPPEGAAETCQRFAGTVAAVAIETTGDRGDRHYANLRGYWNLTGDGRMLLQEYAFRRGGYQVVDAILCRRAGDDRLLCEEPAGDSR